ncbi:MAG: hypothetical protein HOB13_12155 [Lentimicrobiaceae bacterium]|jgi:hypothetical protein|nr:hypothetical protein [Lentimicrobiaceae bacterium]
MNKKIRIGIFRSPWRQIPHWEARIVSELIQDQRYELVCIFSDERKNPDNLKMVKRSLYSKVLNKAKSLTFQMLPTNIILRFIDKMELPSVQGFAARKISTIEIKKHLNKIQNIPLNPVKTGKDGCIDFFNMTEVDKIKKMGLDVILRHEFGIIKGDGIYNSAKYGIWSFHHGDNRVNRGGPAGFWEVFYDESVCGVTLQILENELDGGTVIDRSFHSIRTFWYQTRELVLEKSVELLMKNLSILSDYGSVKKLESGIYSQKLYKYPTFFPLVIYVFRKHVSLRLLDKYKRMTSDIKNRNVWKILVYKGKIKNSVLWRSHTIEPGFNEFWADPFIVSNDNQDYIFFENYCYYKKRAKISVGLLSDKSITSIVDAIATDYHMSYPFIFKKGDVFL